jgi:hypothetical protein
MRARVEVAGGSSGGLSRSPSVAIRLDIRTLLKIGRSCLLYGGCVDGISTGSSRGLAVALS